MPIYDFKCDCGFETEKIVPANAGVTNCPLCGDEMQKQVSAPAAFNLKGGGFYATDFKNQ